jgi:hypothetical protein
LDSAKAIVLAADDEEFDVVESALNEYVRQKSYSPTAQAAIVRHVKPNTNPLPDGVLDAAEQLMELMSPGAHDREKDFGEADKDAQLVIAVRRLAHHGREGYAAILMVIHYDVTVLVAQHDMLDEDDPDYVPQAKDSKMTPFEHLRLLMGEALAQAEQ